ncbi:MAG: hypothetical protein CMQ17_10555 [Gammaproteobacteria bacterium]|nr:hypothetical protein [Gammaproteobacteria bacterium]
MRMASKINQRRFSIVLMRFIVLVCFVSVPITTLAQDPWQATNERLFALNEFFDVSLVKPIATTYKTLVPGVAQQAFSNFLSNIDDVNVVANDILQLKFNAAISDCSRLLLNSVVGIAGFIDVASPLGFYKNEEDFGQTLGHWGVESGPYVVLPVLGASTVRDSAALIVDTLANPIHYIHNSSRRYAMYGAREVEFRSSLLELDDSISGDRYLFLREAYLQRREYLILDGKIATMFDDF